MVAHNTNLIYSNYESIIFLENLKLIFLSWRKIQESSYSLRAEADSHQLGHCRGHFSEVRFITLFVGGY